jgi:TPR repeat protein
MEIMGLGKPKSLPGAAREIQELVKSEEGRQSLKFLAQFYDACVCNELTNVKPKLCKHAAFIHGVILYQLSSNDALAYTNLSSCAGENLYARYCCANMLLQGRGTSKLIDEAASKFRSICGEDDLDGQLRAECWTALREIAATGSIAGLCEYCMACMHKAVPLEEFRIVFDRIWRDHEQRASCLRYLLSASSTQVISRARQENNLRAILLSSFLQVFQCGTIQTIDTKLQLMETAYREIVLAHENKVASDSDFCFVSLYLAMALREKGSLKEARECLEKVAHYDSLDVKIFLAVLLLEDKNSTQEDLQRALGYYEESATKGEVEHQRLLAASYRRNNRAGAANLPVQADIGKSYKFVSMLLAAKPEDVEGRYILGYLLANHGGQMGVPADQHEKAYELLSFAIANKKDVLPEDYYLLGSVCCANRNFELAVNWLERAGDSPQCKCALGLAMLYAVEHGSTLYNREQALTLIEGALSSVRHLLVAKQESYSKLFQDELLVKILTEEVRSGNFRAQTMLARIAYLFDGGVAGVSKERAYAYLVEAAEAGVASAQSFLGFVFLHGIGVQQVESTALERFIKVTRCENVPDFIYDEVAEELFALGRELVASPVHVKAACYGIIALLHNSRPENVKRALMLFEKAELDCLRNFVADKDVTAVIYQSGAWDALKRLALLLRNGNFTSALGMSVIKRFQTGCVDLRFLLVDGLPLIRLAVRQGVAIEQVSCFSQQLLACVYYALQVGGCDFDTLRSILETTQQLDPENKDIAYALATIYMNHKFPDVVPGAGQAKLEALADGGHPLAALDMGVIYLSLGQIGNLVANFKQGIQYLEKAAKKGSCHALSLMASVFLKEKDHNAQYVKKQLQESIEFLLNQRNVGTDEKLFFQAMKALASKRYDEAVGYVAQLSKNPRGAILCILACRILIPHRDGCEKVGAYLISSLEIVCSNHVNIVQAGIIAALRDILIDLDKAASDCKIASYASAIKELLSRYNINLGKV